MRIGLLVLAVIGLSGCAMFQPKHLSSPCGVTDYVWTPVGTVIGNVPLPTDEKKTYNIVTTKPGFWISTACDERIGR